MNGVWIHCTFSLIVKYYPWFWFLLALNSRCYHLQKMAQINVSWDGIPKTLLEEQCAAVLNSRISHQLTWLLGLNIFLSITAVLGNTLILVALGQEISLHAPSKLLLRCLSTTDLLVGLLSEPMYAAYEMSLLNGSLETCRLTFVISFIAGYILSGVSLFTSTAISLDRLSCAINETEVQTSYHFETSTFHCHYNLDRRSCMFYTVLMEWPDTFNVCVRLHIDLFSNLGFFLQNNFRHPPTSANTSSRPY